MVKLDTTIGKANFWGMVGVSFGAIVLLGAAWIAFMLYEFSVESDRLRQDFHRERHELVKSEVQEAARMVEAIRKADLEAVRRSVEDRAKAAAATGIALSKSVRPKLSDQAVRRIVVEIMAAEHGGEGGLFEAHGDTVYLIPSLPEWLDKREAFKQVEMALRGVLFGKRQLSLVQPTGQGSATFLVNLISLDSPAVRIVSGVCLDLAEKDTMAKVVRQLDAFRFGGGETLFGGTWNGDSLLGPAKGRNVLNLTDVNGVHIVKDLIQAAKQGGGFVEYVMPPMGGVRHTDKVSYVMGIPDWQWYLGAGTYVDDIEIVIDRNREHLKTHILYQGGLVLCSLILLSFLSLSISYRLSMKMQANIESFTEVWNRASSKGVEIDVEALHYREFKELAAAANSMALDRYKAEEALAENVERFSTLVSSIPGIVYHCKFDEDWTMSYISDHVLEVTGYPPSDFLNNAVRSYVSIIHQDDRDWVRQSLEREIVRGRSFAVEYRIVRADGGIRWLSERGRSLPGPEGKLIWLDGVIFDVTDRKNAEQDYYEHLHFLTTIERIDRTLHHSESMNEMMSEALGTIRTAFGADRAWLLHPCDPDASAFKIPMERTATEYPGAMKRGISVPMTDEVREMVVDALETLEPLAYYPGSDRSIPRDLEEMFEVQSQLMMAVKVSIGQPWLFGLHQCREARVWTDDEIRLFREVGRRIADGLNSALIFSQLKESEEKFRTFTEQTMLGLCVMQDDKVIFVNKAFADIFEVDVETMMNMSTGGYINYVHPDDRPFVSRQAARKQAGEADVVDSYVWRAVTETGRVKWVEVNSCTATVNGRPANLISLTDVTEIKKAEQGLESVIAERMGGLTAHIDELEDANDRFLRLDRLKSDFLSRVSEALKTPLTSVFGFARLARKELGDVSMPDEDIGRLVGNLAAMESEGSRLIRLIDGFMELDALQTGDALWNEQVVSVEQCVVRSVNHAEYLLPDGADVTLSLEIKGDLPDMLLDADRFERVLGELLENAIDNTPRGSITVRAQSPDGKGVELEVVDTGAGIPEGELESIFEPFHKVADTVPTNGDEEGAGLGLAVCRQIVSHYGGKIWAESTLGKGSTLFVSLPARESV